MVPSNEKTNILHMRKEPCLCRTYSAGLATWYDNGNIEKRHRHLYTTVILPGRLKVVYIYRRNESQTTIFIMPRKGSFPGKRVFFEGMLFRVNGARKAFWASVLNECELLTMHILKKKKKVTPVCLPGRIPVV